ncbi:MAG TPA: hypothetical protein PKV48_06355, partial [Thermodesulfobacteriota bacterium]|nr:hypothetical protein [Thermodesulfobacteriota bacterium]
TYKQEHFVNRKKVFLGVIILGLLSAYFFLLSNILAVPSNMRGLVIDDSKILSDDGKTYKIIDSENVSSLSDYIGKRVEVVGIVEDLNGETEITLNSFKILSDLPNKGRS